MVSLDDGLIEPTSQELKWRRIESLQRSISPVSHILIRFSYGDIVYATRNFSKVCYYLCRCFSSQQLECVFSIISPTQDVHFLGFATVKAEEISGSQRAVVQYFGNNFNLSTTSCVFS